MNINDPKFNSDLLIIILKFLIVAIVIGHVIVIMLISKQIRQADKIAAPYTFKLIQLVGYINIVLSVLILILIILPL
jgi:hypothetical protein